MAFQTGHRRGQVWDDVQTLNKIIHNTRFNLTGESEREFELAFMSSVNANADRINGQILSQVDKGHHRSQRLPLRQEAPP